MAPDQSDVVAEVTEILDALSESFSDLSVVRNRAIAVSIVLLALELKLKAGAESDDFASFIREFICRLQWQVKKGLDLDQPYRYLSDFQKHLTQASVEKPAVTARASFLREQLVHWKQDGALRGDAEYTADNQGADPSVDCQSLDLQLPLLG